MCSNRCPECPRNDRRRALCQICIGGMTVVSAGAVSFPVITFLGFPRRLSAEKPLEVLLSQLAFGQAHYADHRGAQIIVLALRDGPQVFSASCSHLGCNVVWDTAESVFRCPCHGAIFDASGEVVSGPVNAPLTKVPFEFKDGRIIVT